MTFLLMDWLKPGERLLSKLDVACCNRNQRANWLQVLARVRVERDETFNPLNNYLLWLGKRKVQLTQLDVNRSAMRSRLMRDSAPPFQFQKLLCLTFKNDDEDECFSDDACNVNFVSCFTALKVLNLCFSPISDADFKVLCGFLRCPLRTLCLLGSPIIAANSVATVMERMHRTIVELSCSVLDDDALVRISQACRTMLYIHWEWEEESNLHTDRIVEFCSFHPQLHFIHIRSKCSMSQWLRESFHSAHS